MPPTVSEAHPANSRPPLTPASPPRTGRNAVFLGFAKGYFLVTSYATVVVLARVFDAETVGRYGVVAGIVTVANMVLINAHLQGVSRYASSGLHDLELTLRAGFRLALGLGATASFLLVAASTAFGVLFHDRQLADLVRLVAPIPLLYSLYAVNIGYLNGRRRFSEQAALDVGFSTFKCLLVAGTAWLGGTVADSLGGFTLAAGLILLLSFLPARLAPAGGEPISALRMLRFVGWSSAFCLALHLLLQLDLFLLKSVTEEAETRQVGYYTGIALVSRVPYSLMVAVTLLLFPMIANLTSLGDRAAAAVYIREAFRFSAITLLVLTSIVCAMPAELLRLIYPAAYLEAAPALVLLTPGVSCLSLFQLGATLLVSAGRPAAAVALGAVVLAVEGGLVYAGASTASLNGAALGMLGTGIVAVALSQLALRRQFGAGLPVATLARCGLAGAAVGLVAPLLGKGGPVYTLTKASLLGCAALALLVLLRELRREDLRAIRRIL